jgi:hypothetical protein
MADEQRDRGNRAGLGDGQGTTVGTPQPGGQQETAQSGEGTAAGDRQSRLADSDNDQGAPRSTGAAAEATGTSQAAPVDGHTTEHRSGYGGAGGKPVSSSDNRQAATGGSTPSLAETGTSNRDAAKDETRSPRE